MISQKKLDFYIQNNRNVLFTGKHGVGKCLAKGTKVLMFNGELKNVEDVISGDLLMGPDSKPRKVYSTATGQEEMFEIIPRKGESFSCNRSHILCLNLNRDGKDKYVEITVNDYLSQSDDFKRRTTLMRTGVDFENNAELTLDPYMLGVWLADGSKADTGITNVDDEVLEFIDNFAKSNGLKTTAYDITTRISSYTGKQGANLFLNQLKEEGLINNKHIPSKYLVASRNDRLKLLAGLLDGDGYLTNNCYDIVQKNKNIADGIVFVARSLGLAAYVHECQKSCMYKGERKTGTYHRVSISGNTNIIPCNVERRVAAERRQEKDALRTGIVAVNSLGIGDYYGFTLEESDGLFLLGDFTITHNTASIIKAFARHNIKFKYFSVATLDPWVDFVGIPEKVENDGLTYLDLVRPEIFAKDKVEAIFLDEFNRGVDKVRDAVMELIQFRSINGKKLENLRFVWAAINPHNDISCYNVQKLDAAIEDRFPIHIDVPYEIDEGYFAEKYGEKLASRACAWWNKLEEDVRFKISPRRVDYALEEYRVGGDLRDVLPKEGNVTHLIDSLEQDSVLLRLEAIMMANKPEEAKSILQNDTAYTEAIKWILEDKGRCEFFLPVINQEKFEALLTENMNNEAVQNNICGCFDSNSQIKERILQNIQKPEYTHSILKSIPNKTSKNFSKNIKKVKPFKPNKKCIDGFFVKVNDFNRDEHTLAESQEMFKYIKENLGDTDKGKNGCSGVTILMLCYEMSKAKDKATYLKDFPEAIPVLNNCLQVLDGGIDIRDDLRFKLCCHRIINLGIEDMVWTPTK